MRGLQIRSSFLLPLVVSLVVSCSSPHCFFQQPVEVNFTAWLAMSLLLPFATPLRISTPTTLSATARKQLVAAALTWYDEGERSAVTKVI